MNNFKRIFAGLTALVSLFAFSACGSEESTEDDFTWESDAVTVNTENVDTADKVDISGQTIYWLGIYNLNPTKNNPDRSVALTLFEDVYGGKIEYIQTTSSKMFDDLANRIIGGDPVDMFDYQWNAVPYGVYKNQYQPLDDYIDISDPMWDSVRGVIDGMEYQDKHYVVPISTSASSSIIYSRTLMDEEGFDDPYELYKKGEWTWDVFLDMMKTFVSNADEGQTRYGINGWWGHLMVQSTGDTIVRYEDGKFVNNINSPAIEKAETMMEEISKLGLYDQSWQGSFPSDNNTLFYAMGSWALADSNAKNPNGDIFIVPFPKPADADKYYVSADINAYMLVANSDKGDAVARYIECERIAATDEQYTSAAKEKAMAAGELTEEQYDFIQSWQTDENIEVLFDFGYGMGSRMYGDGDYTYETKGVMNNLTDALLEGYEGAPSTWAELRDAWSAVIDEEIATFN